MEITINKEDLVLKLTDKILSNVEGQLKAKPDLSEEEILANLVLAKRASVNDANAIANLVFDAFA